MKRTLLCAFFVLVSAVFGFSQTDPLLTQLTQPYAVPTGVDEIALLNDLQGGFYVVYTEAGRLHVLRGAGEGQLVPYEIDFYGRTITNIHSLSTNVMGPGKFACFLGSENDVERLFFCGVDDAGAFVLYRDPIDGQSNAGAIRRVELRPRDIFINDVYFIKGDSLYVTKTSYYSDGQAIPERVSRSGEKVVDFGAISLSSDAPGNYVGWYTAEKSAEERNVVLYKKNGDQAVLLENLGTAGDTSQIDIEETQSGALQCRILDGVSLRVLSLTATGIMEQTNFTAPAEIKSYFELRDTIPYLGLLTCASEGGETAYLVKNPRSTDPELLPLVEASALSIGESISTEADTVLIVFETEHGWYSTKIDLKTYAISTELITSNSGKSKVMYCGNAPVPRVLLFKEADGGTLSVYFYGVTGWTTQWLLPVTGPISLNPNDLLPEVEPLFNPLLSGGGQYVLSVPEGILFLDNEGKSVTYIKHNRRAWRAFNGKILLTLFSNSEITIYQIGE